MSNLNHLNRALKLRKQLKKSPWIFPRLRASRTVQSHNERRHTANPNAWVTTGLLLAAASGWELSVFAQDVNPDQNHVTSIGIHDELIPTSVAFLFTDVDERRTTPEQDDVEMSRPPFAGETPDSLPLSPELSLAPRPQASMELFSDVLDRQPLTARSTVEFQDVIVVPTPADSDLNWMGMGGQIRLRSEEWTDFGGSNANDGIDFVYFTLQYSY